MSECKCAHSTPSATLTVPDEDMHLRLLKLYQLDLPGAHPTFLQVSTVLSDLMKMETELAKLHFY